jgi:hypothetical protein
VIAGGGRYVQVASCTSFINDIFFNPVQAGGGPAVGRCSVTTNQRNGVVSYAIGSLSYSPGTGAIPPRWSSIAGGWTSALPSVHLGYLFSDRLGPGSSPFSPTKFDDLGLEIALLGNNDQLGITFTLRSWGSAKFPLQVIGCDAGVVYGVGAGIGAAIPDALYAIWVGGLKKGSPL